MNRFSKIRFAGAAVPSGARFLPLCGSTTCCEKRSNVGVLEIKYIGHACVLLSSQSERVLVDPWWNPVLNDGTLHAVPAPVALSSEETESFSDLELPDSECDLSIQYAPEVAWKILFKNWKFSQAHYSYKASAVVRRIVAGQIAVHRWS